MKRFWLGALASLCFAATAHAGSPASNFIDGLASQVLAIAKDSALDKSAKTAKIEALFTDKVDMDFIAKFVVGKNWRAATPAQQSAYIAAYKPFILKNYAGRLARYSGQTYTLKQSRAEGNANIVTMEIADPNGQSFLVDYRLRANGGSYKIMDIVVEGVSLLSTQRSEFSSIIDQKGIDGLTEALRNQVASR